MKVKYWIAFVSPSSATLALHPALWRDGWLGGLHHPALLLYGFPLDWFQWYWWDIGRQKHIKVRVLIPLAPSLLGHGLAVTTILTEGYSSFWVPSLGFQWVLPAVANAVVFLYLLLVSLKSAHSFVNRPFIMHSNDPNVNVLLFPSRTLTYIILSIERSGPRTQTLKMRFCHWVAHIWELQRYGSRGKRWEGREKDEHWWALARRRGSSYPSLTPVCFPIPPNYSDNCYTQLAEYSH